MSDRFIMPEAPEETRVIVYENEEEFECFDPVYAVTETEREWVIEGVRHEYHVPRKPERRLAFQIKGWIEVDYVPGEVLED